jgi:hypothetical protein
MKLPRDLKGSDLAKALCRDWGYRIVHQKSLDPPDLARLSLLGAKFANFPGSSARETALIQEDGFQSACSEDLLSSWRKNFV